MAAEETEAAILAALVIVEDAIKGAERALDAPAYAALSSTLVDVVAALEHVSQAMGRSLEVARTMPSDESWEREVKRLSIEQAEQISSDFAVASERLGAAFKLVKQSGDSMNLSPAIRDAVGFLYADILRPLWRTFAHLVPDEMKEA